MAKRVESQRAHFHAGWAIGLSLVAHASVAFLGIALPTSSPSSLAREESEVFVDFDPPLPEANPETMAPLLEPATREANEPLPRRTSPASSDLNTAPSARVLETDIEPVGAMNELSDPQPEAMDSHRREQLATLMAPSHVASSFAVQDSTGPTATQGPADLSATGGVPTLATEAEVEASLSHGLRTEVMARPWLSHTSPRLVRRPDGSQVYTGHAFTATIRPDGSVDFADRGAVDAEPMLRGEPMRFDMTDMVMRSSGQDPYSAEREWFMEETEDVRVALEVADAERLRTTALARIPGQLAVIWRRTTPATIRRRAIFALWDECDEEGDGLLVRERVIGVIRMEIPSSSPDAFTTEELRRWNADRESSEMFLPYR